MGINIGLFYGSSTCYTEMAGEKIKLELEQQVKGASVTLHNIADQAIALAEQYSNIILGMPTWDYGELQEDWESIWDEIDQVDFNGKTVALYGLGDQVGYPEWFLDAMGFLHNKVVLLGANVIGYWPNEGYDFQESQALTEDKSQFLGLALDDENEFEKTEERIRQWCQQITPHFSS